MIGELMVRGVGQSVSAIVCGEGGGGSGWELGGRGVGAAWVRGGHWALGGCWVTREGRQGTGDCLQGGYVWGEKLLCKMFLLQIKYLKLMSATC